MNATASIEGTLSAQLLIVDSTIAHVGLKSTRTTRIGRLLAGRTMDQALGLVPMLFSLCGMAQGIAASGACERAIGITPSAPQRAARELLILGEMVDSHAWQIAIEWPRLLGEAPATPALLTLRTATASLPPALYPARDWTRPGGGRLSPDRAGLDSTLDRIADGITGLIGAHVQEMECLDDLARWSRTGTATAARLIAGLMADDMAAFGRSGVSGLPALPETWFADRLASDPGFTTEPHVDGDPAETGPLHRVGDHPLIADLVRRHGNGLLPRFAAKLVDLALIPERMRTAAEALDPATAPAAPQRVTGTGAGMAETARGRLAHWIALDKGTVTEYRTVAPNEWNFHPRGAFVRGLVGQPADDDLGRRVDLLVAAMDPCVPCQIAVEEQACA